MQTIDIAKFIHKLTSLGSVIVSNDKSRLVVERYLFMDMVYEQHAELICRNKTVERISTHIDGDDDTIVTVANLDEDKCCDIIISKNIIPDCDESIDIGVHINMYGRDIEWVKKFLAL